jgi:hypothetical protein
MRPKLYLVPDDADPEDRPPSFSDRKYSVPAANELGESWVVKATVMLDENRMMDELIASQVIPHWRTKADFIRWAVHEGLKQIRSELPYLSRDMGRVEALMEYLNHEERRSQFLKMVDKIDHAVKAWLDLGATEEARKLVSNIAERVRSEFSGNEDEWLRTEIAKRLDKHRSLYE